MKRFLPDLRKIKLNNKEIKIIERDFAKGGQCKVSLGEMCNESRELELVAVKRIDRAATHRAFREMMYMTALKSKTILPLISFGHDGECPVIVTPYCEHRSLYQYLCHNALDPTEKTIISYGIIHALRTMHRKFILHRDMKPENVFLDKRKYPFLGDLGLSGLNRSELNGNEQHSVAGNTALYQPPEMHGRIFNHKLDIYGYGMIVWCLIHNRPLTTKDWVGLIKYPTNQVPASVMRNHIERGERPIFDEEYKENEKKIVELVNECWSSTPKDRPSAHEICDKVDENGDWLYCFNGCDKKAVAQYIDYIKRSDSEQEKTDLELGTDGSISVATMEDLFDADILTSGEAFYDMYQSASVENPKTLELISLIFYLGYGCDKNEFLARKYAMGSIEISDSYEAKMMLKIMDQNKTEFSDAFTLELTGRVGEAWKLYYDKIKAGSVEALTQAGMMLLRCRKTAKAFELLDIAAQRMSPEALFLTALRLGKGEECVAKMQKAASLGHKRAAFWLRLQEKEK